MESERPEGAEAPKEEDGRRFPGEKWLEPTTTHPTCFCDADFNAPKDARAGHGRQAGPTGEEGGNGERRRFVPQVAALPRHRSGGRRGRVIKGEG